MDKLTDLEICKRITEIELRRVFPKAKSMEFEKSQACFWVESAGFSSWRLLDPLTDDALCFRLMTQYKISLIQHQNNTAVYCIWDHDEKHATNTMANPNRAICIAIIQSKDQ